MFQRIRVVIGRSAGSLGAIAVRTGVTRRPMLVAVGATVGFVAVVAAQLQPPDPESRLPDQQRLPALIQRQQEENREQSRQVEELRAELAQLRGEQLGQSDELREQRDRLDDAGTTAGLTAVRGTGFSVSLSDSSLDSSPTGNVNDLVIHSQDVQAVVNALWAAGADAISINEQRLVGTSAVLCVGNTLLINGTVHAPPYRVSAVGADRSEYNDDRLVQDFREVAERFSLGYSVSREQSLEVPGYTGSVALGYARKV